jgi:hypothetical protein
LMWNETNGDRLIYLLWTFANFCMAANLKTHWLQLLKRLRLIVVGSGAILRSRERVMKACLAVSHALINLASGTRAKARQTWFRNCHFKMWQ